MNKGILIFLSIVCADNNGLNMMISSSPPDLIHLDKDAVYNLKTDGRGSVTIKSKKSGDRNWSKPQTVYVDGCAGNLLKNGARVIDTKEGYMFGYSPKENEFMNVEEYPVYTTDEYNQMVDNPESINTIFKDDPKFLEGYQNGNKDTVFYEYKPTEKEKKMADDLKDSKDSKIKDKDKDKDKDSKEDENSSEKDNKSESKEDEDSDGNGAISITTLTLVISTILTVGATAYI